MFLESADVIFRVSLALLEHHKDAIMSRNNFEEIMGYLKNVVPNVDAETISTVMRRTFALQSVSRQLLEYQVEYNVLQEEISSQNNRAREENRQLETQLQIAQSSIAQLEKTRFTQQTQIQSLQSQVQSLEVTVETIGQFINQLIDTRHDIEFPGAIRRIAAQIQNAETRKRGGAERKICKSLSMTSHLGGMLKVLEEETLAEQHQSPAKKGNNSKKVAMPLFDDPFEQMRHQKSVMRLNTYDGVMSVAPDLVAERNGRTPNKENSDSGIATPLSPNVKENLGEQQQQQQDNGQSHPFSECNDVNFRFSGTTTQLKSKSNNNNRLSGGTGIKSPTGVQGGAIPRQLIELEKNGRA